MSTVTDLESYQQWAEQQQAQNNAWSAEQAQKQMDFQKMMSDTAHQREVADLKAAGLNPILSANSGAQVTQGAQAEGDRSTAGNVGNILQQVLSAQSAREVAAMYNSATIYAAQIAAQASMYGADMSYKNSEDHPKTPKEVLARLIAGSAFGGSWSNGNGMVTLPGTNISLPQLPDDSPYANRRRSGSTVSQVAQDVLKAITGVNNSKQTSAKVSNHANKYSQYHVQRQTFDQFLNIYGSGIRAGSTVYSQAFNLYRSGDISGMMKILRRYRKKFGT